MEANDILIVTVLNTTIIGSSIWAAYDSSKIGLCRYKTGISYRPWILFLLMIIFWYVSLPWYLIVRHKIKHGQVPLIDLADQRENKQGLRSARGKFSISALGLGIVIFFLIELIQPEPERLALWPQWILWSTIILSLLAFFAIIFGAFFTLYIIASAWRKKDVDKYISVTPTNYRRIAIRAIEECKEPMVWMDSLLVEGFSEDGPLVQGKIRNCIDFLIKDGNEEVLGFHDHPNEMWITEKYRSVAEYCQKEEWLKIGHKPI
jgi:hypothetical protein